MNNPLNQILQSYHENHLSHAFLIETNDQEKCLNDLKEVISEINCENSFEPNCNKCNLCHLIQTNQLPSLVIVKPDGMTVKKEQILELKKYFSTKPIYSKFNMYVIMYAEKLNNSSANTILKFLEEPESGILGFFITNNKENIIDTIKSRCQIISNFYQLEDNINEDLQKLAVEYLKNVHLTNDFTLIYNRSFILDHDLKKEDFQQIFQHFFTIYYSLYKSSLHLEDLEAKYAELQFLLKKESSYFIKQLQIVSELEKELGYNVNINLLLDRFILETRS